MELKDYKIKRTFKENIEPEEILLDATKSSEMEDQRIEVPIRPKIFKNLFYLMAAGIFILAGYSFYLQILHGNYYQDLAKRNRLRSIPIFASRGIIYDRNGKQLVYNAPSFDLVLSVPDLPRDQAERQTVIARATEISGVTTEEILQKLKEADVKSVPIFAVTENLAHEKMLSLEANLNRLPGFRIEKNISRQYIDAPYFFHILGYLGKLDSEDVKKNPDYFLTEKIGKNGLEFSYENILRGQPGEELFEADSLGRIKNQVAQEQPKDGQGLVLAIDAELQQKLYDTIASSLRGRNLKKAAALALNPQSGDILAMVSFPSFNNNLFAQGISSADYDNLITDASQPLFNRAISGQYEPGSTVKPLVGSAALQEKVVSPSTKIFDPGELVLVNQYNPQIVYRFPDWKAHGIVDIYSAIAESCDVYFYTIGGGYGNIKGLGIERLEKYFKAFGFGGALGLDLPGEATGLVPNDAWKQKTKKESWYTGDTYHISIGQGDLLVTPLQLAVATAAIVNGGKIIQPHLVDRIIDSDKNIIKTIEPNILRENFIDLNNLEVIKKGMRQTVTAGSAQTLNDLKIDVGAKTGTAQVAGQENPNAWATVFAPYDSPRIVLVVLVENAGEGSQVSVPIAKEVLKEYFK